MLASWQVWAKIERAAGDEDRAKELIRASVNLKGAGAAAINAGAKFMERTVGGNRAARKLYERVLSMDPGYAPSLQVRTSLSAHFLPSTTRITVNSIFLEIFNFRHCFASTIGTDVG